MFARFEGRKSLKKSKNVDVHDDKVECGNDRDNIKYVEVVDSDDEELVSEEFDESEKMYDDIGSMHESSGNLHIVIIMLMEMSLLAVSYTHLTLPTIYSV